MEIEKPPIRRLVDGNYAVKPGSLGYWYRLDPPEIAEFISALSESQNVRRERSNRLVLAVIILLSVLFIVMNYHFLYLFGSVLYLLYLHSVNLMRIKIFEERFPNSPRIQITTAPRWWRTRAVDLTDENAIHLTSPAEYLVLRGVDQRR
jgi:hypothetical protein